MLPPLAANAEIQLGRKLRWSYDLDSIFDENNAISEQGDRQLFHLVQQELAQYPGATVRIGVHLDNETEPEASRQLSLQLAQTLEQYLRNELGNSDTHTWLPIGFGASRPLVPNDSDANRQRNRRVEIGID
ncbi:MAG: OmpA family protein [Spirulinaceae cyanobacterium RM2_2_10]|nr:OmpA family protein [Spirulinaceae cyanobacterium RM2_2_10]